MGDLTACSVFICSFKIMEFCRLILNWHGAIYTIFIWVLNLPIPIRFIINQTVITGNAQFGKVERSKTKSSFKTIKKLLCRTKWPKETFSILTSAPKLTVKSGCYKQCWVNRIWFVVISRRASLILWAGHGWKVYFSTCTVQWLFNWVLDFRF